MTSAEGPLDPASGSGTDPLTFPDLPRLELEEALSDLRARAGTVLQAQGRLRALLAANAVVGSEVSQPALIERIVIAARDLVGARYAALGVVAANGSLEQFVHVGVEPDTAARIGHLPRGHGLLGHLSRQRAPLRLDDLSAHPATIGFPAGHPAMRSFLGVPILIRDEVFGIVLLGESFRGCFTEEDEQLVSSLARTAAVAIHNARLFEDSERRRRWQAASTQATQRLFTGDDARPLEVIARCAVEGAEGDVAVLDNGNGVGEQVVVGRAAEELSRQPGDGWPRAVDRVVQTVRRTGQPLLVVPAAESDGSGDDLAKKIGSLLAAPLLEGGRVTDVLMVARVAGRPPFGAIDLEQLATYAGHAEVALELDRSRADQQTMALLQEHERIAADLHDHVIQQLFATGMALQGMVTMIDRPQLKTRLVDAVDALDATIGHIRATIFALQHESAINETLKVRVLRVVEEEKAALTAHVDVNFSGDVNERVNAALAADVLAVVRESLSNAARHARADTVRVSVELDGDRLDVLVEDDGIGMGSPERSSGLTNLRRRAERHHGDLTITSAAEQGTTLRWTASCGV